MLTQQQADLIQIRKLAHGTQPPPEIHNLAIAQTMIHNHQLLKPQNAAS